MASGTPEHKETFEPRKRAHSSPLAAGLAREQKIDFHPFGEPSPRLAAGRVQSFKKSFFYGKRSDLSFKFLSHLSDDQATRFFQGLMTTLVDTYDSGDAAPVYEHIRQGQMLSYAQEARAVFDTGPFTPMATPLSRSRLMLLTSSGHFVDGHDPNPMGIENLTQVQAERQIMSFLKEPPVQLKKTVARPPACRYVPMD